MERRFAQRAAYRIRHLDDPAPDSRLAGFVDGYDSAVTDVLAWFWTRTDSTVDDHRKAEAYFRGHERESASPAGES